MACCLLTRGQTVPCLLHSPVTSLKSVRLSPDLALRYKTVFLRMLNINIWDIDPIINWIQGHPLPCTAC